MHRYTSSRIHNSTPKVFETVQDYIIRASKCRIFRVFRAVEPVKMCKRKKKNCFCFFNLIFVIRNSGRHDVYLHRRLYHWSRLRPSAVLYIFFIPGGFLPYFFFNSINANTSVFNSF